MCQRRIVKETTLPATLSSSSRRSPFPGPPAVAVLGTPQGSTVQQRERIDKTRLSVSKPPEGATDAERFLPMLDRQIARRGVPPRQTAADGGYASRDNLKQAKARGVQDVAFHKKCGIALADMVKSPWVYRRLRNFRAGIEAGISCFKRVYGGARCTWRGLDHFKAYIWSAVVAHNLMLFARLKLA